MTICASLSHKELKQKAHFLRKQVLEMCVKAETGHVTSSFSCVEILVSLYYSVLGEWDRFLLSKGHASPLLYAILSDKGYFSEEELWKFCQADGIFGVHLQHDVPGAEITAGSLGYGLGIGAGMALAKKLKNEPGTIYVLLGDGECYEGSIWESAMFISHNCLDVVAIVDRNGLSATDFTEKALRLEPLGKKWKTFGWNAIEVDGHHFEALLPALGLTARPLVIIAKTVKGKGIPFMENQPLWHAVAPKGEEAERARRELDENTA